MTDKNKIESRLEALGSGLRGQESVVDDVMARVSTMPCPTKSAPEQKDAVIWRLIMNRYARMAAVAAMLILAAIVVVTTIDKTTPAAYALEQTVAAFDNIRFVQVNDWEIGKDEPVQIWMEYSDTGEPVRARLTMPEWKNPQDGPKEAVWSNGVAQVYMPKKNVFVTVAEKRLVRELAGIAAGLDAGALFKIMVEHEKSGEYKVEIAMPSKDGGPIVVTSTGTSVVKKFYIDSTTKLLSIMETCSIDDKNNHTLQYRMECDYVRPEGDIFAIQVPEGTTNIDMVNTIIGIPQGEMTDEQAAKETVRQFWQALIDHDYHKAGFIFSGVPADRMQEIFGKLKVLRIFSIEEPSTDEITARTGGFRVKSVVEMDIDGARVQKSFGPLVRKGDNPAYPDNWMIHGGI